MLSELAMMSLRMSFSADELFGGHFKLCNTANIAVVNQRRNLPEQLPNLCKSFGMTPFCSFLCVVGRSSRLFIATYKPDFSA